MMNDAALLERRYRWLLWCYPRWFRDDIQDELLGVLMAGARDGQRWPSAAEAADVAWTALRMRFRPPPPGSRNRGWSDARAAFSVLAPIIVLVTNLVVVEVPPYFIPARAVINGRTQIWPHVTTWLQLAGDARPFYILLLFQAAVVVAVLAGWRWVALALTLGSAWYGIAGPGMVDYLLPPWPLTWAAYILEPLALLASPGPRRGRSLLTWRHGAVLVLAVASVKLFSLTPFVSDELVHPKPPPYILLIVAAVLAVAAVTGPAALRQGGRMSLLMAALLYPSVIGVPSASNGPRWDAGVLMPGTASLYWAIVLLMPLVMAVFSLFIAARRRLATSGARLTPGS